VVVGLGHENHGNPCSALVLPEFAQETVDFVDLGWQVHQNKVRGSDVEGFPGGSWGGVSVNPNSSIGENALKNPTEIQVCVDKQKLHVDSSWLLLFLALAEPLLQTGAARSVD
jgi:hypothetical protein